MTNGDARDQLYQHRDKIIMCLQACIERMHQTPEQELLKFMREQNKALIDWLDDEDRWLGALMGEEVKPKVHYAHAVMLPAGGGGG